MSESEGHNTQTRRSFLGHAGAAIAGGIVGMQEVLKPATQAHESDGKHGSGYAGDEWWEKDGAWTRRDPGALTGVQRANYAYELRVEAARRERKIPIPPHRDNGDEERYAKRIGNFTKGLKHNSLGEVIPEAYDALLKAICSGYFRDFERLAPYLGSPDPARQRPLVNPEAAYAYVLEGTDPGQLSIPPAPRFASAEEAGEMVELYWMALLRDVNFDDYAENPLAQEAANDLSQLSDFKGPKENGRVTPQTLFRDSFPGCTTGPYISQFLLRQINFGAQFIDQRIEARAPGSNYMTQFPEWLDVQNGCIPSNLVIPVDPQATHRFIRNGRDISHYVRLDVLYQAYFVAALILLDGNIFNETTSPFLPRFPFDAGNPYGPNGSTFVQAGFGTFGDPYAAALVTLPSTNALKAIWYQKWRVHRRLRPEAFGGYAEVMRQNLAKYPVNPDLYRSSVLSRILSETGSYLLPQAFPEGSPLHPSYGTGHGTVAGACVTMLKAFFDESTVINGPVQINPADGGQTLIPYEGPDLTVGGELNKLASNIATGRNIAGVHWRSDGFQSLMLGEQVAISILRDMRETYGEPYSGFSLTKFDGTRIKV